MSNTEKKEKIRRPFYLTVIAILVIILMAIILCCCRGNRYTSISFINGGSVSAGKMRIEINHNSMETTDFQLRSLVKPGDIITIGEDGEPGQTSIEIVNKGNMSVLFLSNFSIDGDIELANVFYFNDLKISYYKEGSKIKAVEEWLIKEGEISDKIIHLDGNLDGKISIKEWLSVGNNLNGIDNGWELVGLPKNGVYELNFTLMFARSAGNEYLGKSIEINFHVLSSQLEGKALEWLMKKNNIPNPERAREIYSIAISKLENFK